MRGRLQTVAELQYQYPRRGTTVGSITASTKWDRGSADDVLRLINMAPIQPTGSTEEVARQRLYFEQLVNTEMPRAIATYGAALQWMIQRVKPRGEEPLG